MICPKCGFEQPESLDCARCGIVFSRYKGAPAPSVEPQAPPLPPDATPPPPPQPPAAFQAAPPPLLSWPPAEPDQSFPAVPPPPPPPPASGDGSLYSYASAPASAAAGGTLYQGPEPTGGATLYEGPPPGALAQSGPRVGPLTADPQPFDGSLAYSFAGFLSEACSIYFRDFLAFLIIPLVVVLTVFFALYLLVGPVFGNSLSNGVDLQSSVGGFLLWVATVLSIPFATAALTYRVFQRMQKRGSSLLVGLRIGLSSVLSALGVILVQALLTSLTLVPVLLLGVLSGPGMIGMRFVRFGIIPLLLALAYLTVVVAVTVPAAVEEKLGIAAALRRSAELTEEFRFSVFGVLASLALLYMAMSSLLNKMVFDTPRPGAMLALGAVQLIFSGLAGTATAVMYYRLRNVKDMVDMEDMVSVYD